jgi:uncharacterized YigZ family protein
MSGVYKTVYRAGKGETEEKKSRFIAHIAPAASENEAAAFISSVKKEYWDARHNCSAFVVGMGANRISRCSDDGEPSGTAGKPMLEVLTGEGLTDVVAVVTRYFGGVLLGTGGLIRAYTAAIKAGLEESVIIEKKQGIMVTLRCDYTLEGMVRRFLKDRNLPLMGNVYSESVELDTIMDMSLADRYISELISESNARAEAEKVEEAVYALADGEVILF